MPAITKSEARNPSNAACAKGREKISAEAEGVLRIFLVFEDIFL
jgi:hypothetical protein